MPVAPDDTGIDALMVGHSHLIFPQAKETGGPRSIHRWPHCQPIKSMSSKVWSMVCQP
jgi:hypothetical protein